MSGSARDQILARIRAATGPQPTGPTREALGGQHADREADADAAYAALPREYLRAHHDPAAHDIAALFAERAADYRAVVERVPEPGAAGSPRPSPAIAGRPGRRCARHVRGTGRTPGRMAGRTAPARSRWPATSRRWPRPNSTGLAAW